MPGIASRYFTSGLARSSTDPKYTTLPPFCATSTTHGGHTVSGELCRRGVVDNPNLEKQELVEHEEDLAGGLVDGADDGAASVCHLLLTSTPDTQPHSHTATQPHSHTATQPHTHTHTHTHTRQLGTSTPPYLSTRYLDWSRWFARYRPTCSWVAAGAGPASLTVTPPVGGARDVEISTSTRGKLAGSCPGPSLHTTTAGDAGGAASAAAPWPRPPPRDPDRGRC